MIAPAERRTGPIRVHTLGRLRFSDIVRADASRMDTPALMLAYLAVERSADPDALAGLFYPDLESGRAAAAVEDALRVIGERAGMSVRRPDGRRVELDGRIECDAHAFVDDVKRGRYAAALARYGGTFLDGAPAVQSVMLRHWVHGWRSRLTELHVRAAHRGALLDTAESVEVGAAFVDRAGRLAGANRTFDRLCPEASRSRMHVIEHARLRLTTGLSAAERVRPEPRLVVAARVVDGDEVALVQVRRATSTGGAGDLNGLGLTPAQQRVARGLAAGLANRTIARRLGVSEHTARRHTEQIFVKLGVSSRAEAAVRLVSTA